MEDLSFALECEYLMGFAREVADQMYFTDKGVILEQGNPIDFFSNPQHERTKEFLSKII